MCILTPQIFQLEWHHTTYVLTQIKLQPSVASRLLGHKFNDTVDGMES